MTFTFSSNDEVDYAQLGMCPICAVRFTHGCEHSNTIESQKWLAAYIVAEQLDSESIAKLVAEFSAHPIDEAQKIEREIDAMLDNRPIYSESELTRKTKAEAANRKPWPKYGYTGADSKGTVDVSDIPAYSTHKPMVHKGGAYDQHESHAWTVDGE